MSTGMVAENSDMVFSSGVCSSIVFMSSMKPMSSMVSASSSTTWVAPSSLTEPRLMWSMSLPGVATITSGFLRMASI